NPRRSRTTRPQSPTTPESPTVTADLPAFLPPSPPADLPNPSADAAGDVEGLDVPVPPSTAASSTQGSTKAQGKAAAQVVPVDPELYVELGSVAFTGIGLLLHQRLECGDDNDAWIPDA